MRGRALERAGVRRGEARRFEVVREAEHDGGDGVTGDGAAHAHVYVELAVDVTDAARQSVTVGAHVEAIAGTRGYVIREQRFGSEHEPRLGLLVRREVEDAVRFDHE